MFYAHWARGSRFGNPIDLMLTALGSQGPRGTCLCCEDEAELAISLSFSRGVRLFLGEVMVFCSVLTRDLDLDRVRFFEVSRGIGRLSVAKNRGGRLFLVLVLSICSPGGGREGVISMLAS